MRPLLLDAVPGRELYDGLRAALDGGRPVLPVPTDPAERARLPVPDEVEDGVALLVPTSGSTGVPKLVALTPECLRASAAATAARVGEGRWWLTLPVTHVAGLQVVLRSLAAGHEPSLDPAGCTHTSLVPTQLRRLDVSSFDTVLLGGAAAPAQLPPNVVTTYGMTETSGGCVYDGVPLDGVTVEVGETVVLRGPLVARGYVGGEPFDGAFVTSDLGVWEDGRLVVLGRADDVINTGGEKVAPVLVERALGQHPSVAEVAVVGLPDEEWGQRVVAFVVGALSLEEARAWVAERVSRVAAPREVRLVEALPLLPTGKVDRARLRSGG